MLPRGNLELSRQRLRKREIKSFWRLLLPKRRLCKTLRKLREPNAARKLLSFSNTTSNLKPTKLLTRSLWMSSFNKRPKDSTK